MRAATFIFAFALVASTMAFAPSRQMANILAQVHALMESGGPAQAVFDLINNMQHEVNQEQSKHDALRAKQQKQCSDEINFRVAEINKAQDAIERSSAHQQKCAASEARDEASLKQNLLDQEDLHAQVKAADDLRSKRAAAYGVRVTEHRDANEAIDACEAFLDDLVANKVNLVQIASAATALVQKAVVMRNMHVVAPAITAMVQVATAEDDGGVDGSSIDRVRTLFENVRQQINDAFDAYTEEETKRIEAYKALRAELLNQIDDREKEEATLRKHKAEMALCQETEEAVQAEAGAKISRNAGLKASAEGMCAAQEKEWEQATEARKDELKVIGELRALVQKRFSQMSKSVYARADTEEFKEYENKSDYVEKDYQKKENNFNAEGGEQVGYVRDRELERFI